jgi:hypothetical protein
MIFWTIVHMVLFGYFCGLSARVSAVSGWTKSLFADSFLTGDLTRA